jgi:hypothetical protein
VTRAALPWSRYVDATAHFDELDKLLARCPTAMIAPGHGNVITRPDHVVPIIREAFRLAFEDTVSRVKSG